MIPLPSHHALGKTIATNTAVLLIGACGCAAPPRPSDGSIASAWRESPAAPDTDRMSQSLTPLPAPGSASDRVVSAPIATVNGRPISRAALQDLLMRSRGLEVLEQLIGLEVVQAEAQRAGVSVSASDVDREYDRSLVRLTDPLAAVNRGSLGREQAKQLLDAVLADRNVSAEEFRLVMRRNALLRKLVAAKQEVTTEQLQQEYHRRFDRRAEIRHIQLATLADVDRVKRELERRNDFSELARRYSANPVSAQAGGLLDPFAPEDEEVPALLRQTAFSMEPGQVSDALRIGEWFHLIKLERIIPATTPEFDDVRKDLEASLKQRMAESAMFALFERLYKAAKIDIDDPALRDGFTRRHRGRKP